MSGHAWHMRTQLISLGTKVVTAAPKAALHIAGTAWGVGGAVVEKVLHLGGEAEAGLAPAASKPSGAAPKRSSEPEARLPEAEAPKGVPTPSRAESRTEGVVESHVQLVPDIEVEEEAPAHQDLPLEDFDHLTVGSLRSRIRSLDLTDVRLLHAYEAEHANRLPVIAVLANRIAKLEKEQTTASAGA
jgi:hypothetical protein